MSESDGGDRPTPSDDAPTDASIGDATGNPVNPTVSIDGTGRTGALAGAGSIALALCLVAFAIVAARSAPTTSIAAAVPTPPTASPPAPGTTSSTSTTTTTTEPIPVDPGTTTTTRKPRKPPTGPAGPLTGAPVDLPGYERRQALVVKIDNYDPNARPQAGLTLADIVYEEKVEGPVSRFAAIFHGSDAPQIGPVRSARSTDIQIVGNLRWPLFAYSGANGGFQGLLGMSPLVDVGAGRKGGAYWRGGDKPVPHNLYTSSALLYAGTAGAPPPTLWPFRAVNEAPGPGAVQATAANYHFGGHVTSVRWTWDAAEKKWMRMQNNSVHFDLDNWPVGVENVIIQYVRYQSSSSQDMYGNPIPEAVLGGEGRGWVLTGGAAIPMKWLRYALDQPASYIGPDEQLIRFAPGHTWIALVPIEFPATVAFANGTLAS